jgi:hypothetical protein
VTIDAARLARAVHLDATRQPDGSWIVTGGSAAQMVDAQARACSCPDFQIRGTPCKHLLRVAISTVEAEILAGLRALVPLPSRSRRRLSVRK